LITTLPKAKELRPFVEKAITLGRYGSNSTASPADIVHARRTAADYFIGGHGEQKSRPYKKASLQIEPSTGGVAALDKLFDSIGPRFADRPGGYTRIIKLGFRKGDGAEIALIELIGSEVVPTRVKEEKPAKGAKKAVKNDDKATDKKAKAAGKTGSKKEETPVEEAPAKKRTRKKKDSEES